MAQRGTLCCLKLVGYSQLAQTDLLACLSAVAASQEKRHLKLALDKESAAYRIWLTKGHEKGLRGLFRCLSSHEAPYLRPFRNMPADARPQARRSYWTNLWGDLAQPLDLGDTYASLRAKAIEQQGMLPDPSLASLKRSLKSLPHKAGGPDGITFDLLRQLPEPGVISLWNLVKSWERQGQLPQQLCVSLVILLAKNSDSERPIALTHCIYRWWCRVRRPLIKQWQLKIPSLMPWERCVPGCQVIDGALMRLMQSEVAQARGHYSITLLIDLNHFYDRVPLETLLRNYSDFDFPPLLLLFALQVYSGPRIIQAEHMVSQPVYGEKGILAGCPWAPQLAKIVLAKPMQEFIQKFPRAALSVWVDDISLMFTGSNPKSVALEAVSAYRSLHKLLCEVGLSISIKKTGYLTSSVKVKKHVAKISRKGEPAVHDVMKDLGVDSSGARCRRIKAHRERQLKGNLRRRELKTLRVPTMSFRVRLHRGAIHSVMAWGAESLGIPPARMKVFRLALAQHLGLQKGGNLDVLFLAETRYEDPQNTLIKQHVKTVRRLMSQWPADMQSHLEQGWLVLWTRLSQCKHPWRLAKGPISATMSYFLQLGWNLSEPWRWRRPLNDNMVGRELRIDSAWHDIVQVLETELREQSHFRVSSLPFCQRARQGLDWQPFRKSLKKLQGIEKTALRSWTQGSLRHSGNSAVLTCPICNVDLTVQHLVWECSWHATPVPDAWRQQWQSQLNPELWHRGLVVAIPRPNFCCGDRSLQGGGLWADADVICHSPNLAYAVHATQCGPSSDSRVAKVVASVVCGQLIDSKWQTLGWLTAIAPGKQTLFRGQIYGLVLLALSLQSEMHIPVVVNSGVVAQAWQRLGVSKNNQDLFTLLPTNPEIFLTPAPVNKIGSHWSSHGIAAARALATQRARSAWTAEDAAFAHVLQTQDQFVSQVYKIAAQRIANIFKNKQHFTQSVASEAVQSPPSAEAPFVKRKHSKLELLQNPRSRPVGEQCHVWKHGPDWVECLRCQLRLHVGLTWHALRKAVHSKCADPVECMQSQLPHEARMPNETKKQYFQRLVGLTQAGHSLAHQWEWSGKQSLIKCVKCSKWMSLSRSWEHVHDAIRQPCVNDAVPSLPNKLKVHASHNLERGPRRWQCKSCLSWVFDGSKAAYAHKLSFPCKASLTKQPSVQRFFAPRSNQQARDNHA